MMKWIFSFFVIISAVFSIFLGNTEQFTNSILDEGVNAVELSFYLLGGMCVWGGIMNVADKAGITYYLSLLFRPIAKIIFKGIDLNGKAFKAISMNITANLLGLGNAATPFGLEAMKALEQEDKTTDTASRNMIIFTVLNTASLTIIPSTAASLRLKHNAENPLDILPLTLINSVVTAVVVISFASFICRLQEKKEKKGRK